MVVAPLNKKHLSLLAPNDSDNGARGLRGEKEPSERHQWQTIREHQVTAGERRRRTGPLRADLQGLLLAALTPARYRPRNIAQLQNDYYPTSGAAPPIQANFSHLTNATFLESRKIACNYIQRFTKRVNATTALPAPKTAMPPPSLHPYKHHSRIWIFCSMLMLTIPLGSPTTAFANTQSAPNTTAKSPKSTKVKHHGSPSEESAAVRDRRLHRECKGRPNAGACLGYARP